MKRIEIIISPTGQSRLETKGYSGSECTLASRFLESALGSTRNEQRTSAYFEVSQQNDTHLKEET